MKKVFAFLSAFVCVFSLCAFSSCGCSEKKFSFPESAQEEYSRIYNIADGKAFDFSDNKTFTLRQTVSVDSEAFDGVLNGSGSPVYPISAERLYRYDSRNASNIKSSVTDTTIKYDGSDIVSLPRKYTERILFANGALCKPYLDHNGVQTSGAVTPIKRYASYAEYFADSEYSYDAELQNIAPVPMEMFATFSGGVSGDGKNYNISGEIAKEKYIEFFELFAKEYSFISWYTQIGDSPDARTYDYFIDPRFMSGVKIDISTTAKGLDYVTVTIVSGASPRPIEGIKSNIVLTATTVYSQESFLPDTITAPPYKEEDIW